MRAHIWNIRGFGRRGRRRQLSDFLQRNKIDVIFLQETIKQDFALQELESLEFGDKFFWSWLPTVGHSGGMLLGFRDSMFEVGSMEKGNFFLSASVVHRVSSFIF